MLPCVFFQRTTVSLHRVNHSVPWVKSIPLVIQCCLVFSRDNNLLVQSELFSTMGKIQPFTASMSTNSQLLLDFHCHLTTSEVVGYLGGKWDYTTQHLSIQQTFPCRCRLGDSQNAPLVEEEVCSVIFESCHEKTCLWGLRPG